MRSPPTRVAQPKATPTSPSYAPRRFAPARTVEVQREASSAPPGGFRFIPGVSQPGDAAELEADRVAARVLSSPAGAGAPSTAPPAIQRQASSGAPPSPGAAAAVAPAMAGGRPLDAASRAFFEPRFGCGFDDVRVHDDPAGNRAASSLAANAFTVGQHVVFDQGRYAPGTPEGRRLIAHELTHVVQQRSGARRIQRDPKDKTDPNAKSAGASPFETRLVQSFDVDRKPNTRPWKLDPLALDIATTLRANPLAYVQVNAVDASDSKDEDHKQNAYERADLVRRAIYQWLGPKQFGEERYQVGFSTGTNADPQVSVYLASKGNVISKGSLSGLPDSSPTTAKKPAAGGLPDVGLGKITTIDTKYVTIKIPKGVTLKAPELAGATQLKLALTGEITDLSKLVSPPTPPTPTPGQPAAVTPPPPIKVGLALNAKGNESISFVAQTSYDVGTKTASAGVGVIIKGEGCQIMVPPEIISKVNEAVKLLQANNAFLPEQPKQPDPATPTPAGQIVAIVQAIDTLYDQMKKIDKLKEKCQPPKTAISAGVKVPLGDDIPGQPARDKQLMITVTLFFN